MSTMASEVIDDALPFTDQEYDDPDMREAAISLIEDEKRRYKPSKNYLKLFPALNTSAFETEIMRIEFSRLENRLPMEIMNIKHYELPPPPTRKLTAMSGWNDCLENSMAQLEHQAKRITNLELTTDYGIEAWKSYLEVLMKCITATQTQVTKLKKQIQEINSQQKNGQMRNAEQLRDLKTNWIGLVSKFFEIELACANLEKQIKTYESAKPGKMNTTD